VLKGILIAEVGEAGKGGQDQENKEHERRKRRKSGNKSMELHRMEAAKIIWIKSALQNF